MGRAIVRQPQVFLMDEPLSNLDAKLRVQTRTQIASLQRRLGVTTVYVTHDQVEAMTMGDRVAVLKDGLLMQCDTPRRMYDHPDNVFVAGFIGSPAMNLLEVPVIDGGVKFGTSTYPIEREHLAERRQHRDRRCPARGPRPSPPTAPGSRSPSRWSRSSAPTPTSTAPPARAPTRTRSSRASTAVRRPQKGSVVNLVPDHGHVHLFNTETGQRIGD